MQRALLLHIVVAECATILKLLASKDQTLLVWRDALLVLDLGLHVLNGVAGLDIEGNGPAGQCANKYLHCHCSFSSTVKDVLCDANLGKPFYPQAACHIDKQICGMSKIASPLFCHPPL